MLPKNIKYVGAGDEIKNQTVIAHISDLHFSAQTKPNDFEWYALAIDLKNLEESVDLLVVTGDLIDAGFGGLLEKDEASIAFKNVYTYLKELCTSLGIDPEERLVVVPGNHDYRLKGLLKRRVQSEKFFQVFKDHFRPVFLPSLGVCVFAVDSNALETGINLATGLVERNDLLDFFDFVEHLRDNRADELNSCIRIVLLHHHPMPIAATEYRGFLEQPGFLLLKNAGQFMTSMVGSKIDLILHGHQHYPAFSKASFRTDNGNEHLVTVIGAGSVGRASNYHRSYNVIKITQNREIRLERRILPGAKYERSFSIPVRTFEEARRLAFEALATRAGAKLRARKFSRVYAIKSGSGDADLHERLEDVTAYSDDVKELPTAVNSISGFFYTPEYECSEGQNMRWIWKSESFTASRREANIVFDPPLTRDRPIDFERRGKIYNLFHFNQQERRDATEGKLTEEFIELTIQNAFDLLVLTVAFPEDHFPEKFYRVVHDHKCFGKEHGKNCTRDIAEEEYFSVRFSKFKKAHTIVVSIEKPLPGYTYWIYWTLPPMEEDERNLNAQDRGRALALTEKLLQLRATANQQAKVKSWFDVMRQDIINSKLWTSLDGDDELEICLYVYDPALRGLVCVANSLGANWSKVIKSGQTLVGAAYRRREHMLYSPLVSHRSTFEISDNQEYLHRVPEDWRSGTSPHTAICAIPLIYPIAKGCKIGVITFSSKSASARLINFVPQKGTTLEVKAAGDALVEDVMLRQVERLATTLGIKVSNDAVPLA